MHRDDSGRPDWAVADLGQSHDNRYLHRAISIPRAARVSQGPHLVNADLIVARNLDMLLVALAARRRAELNTPIIYECLDIHRLVGGDDAVGAVVRQIERCALRRCVGYWFSSPAFKERHFSIYHPKARGGRLLENRLQVAPAPRPQANSLECKARKLRIGWFGNLRCARSLSLLRQVARRFGNAVEIVLRGYPAENEIPDFYSAIASEPSIVFGGRYRWPDELASIYGSVDMVWAGDFMDPGKNSSWLLPNRLYEGGWFACPPIAPSASQTGKWIAEHDSGFTLNEPLDETLLALIGSLVANREPLLKARERLLALPEETFIEPKDTLKNLVSEALD